MRISKTYILIASLLYLFGSAALASTTNAILIQNTTKTDLKLDSINNTNITFGDKSLPNIQLLPKQDLKGKLATINGPDQGTGYLQLDYLSDSNSSIGCKIELSADMQGIQSGQIASLPGKTCNGQAIKVDKGYHFIINN